MTFSEWLRDARAEKGYSLRQLAKRANNVCTFGYINQIEQGTVGKKGQEYQPDLEIVDALAIALEKDPNEARIAAGYAPTDITSGPPQTLTELLDRLESMGITNLHFADEDKMRFASPDQLQEVLDAVKFAIQLTVQKQQNAPTNAHLRPDERTTLP